LYVFNIAIKINTTTKVFSYVVKQGYMRSKIHPPPNYEMLLFVRI